MRTSYLQNEVLEGQKRMWEIKARIKAAYKYNKPEFHRVSGGRERAGDVAGNEIVYATSIQQLHPQGQHPNPFFLFHMLYVLAANRAH